MTNAKLKISKPVAIKIKIADKIQSILVCYLKDYIIFSFFQFILKFFFKLFFKFSSFLSLKDLNWLMILYLLYFSFF